MIRFRYVGKVSIGDEVLVKENAELIPTKVVNVSSAMMQGKQCF